MSFNREEFFREVTLRFCASLNIEEALSHAFEYLTRHVPADTIGLGYSDLSQSKLKVVAKASRKGAKHLWKNEMKEIPISDELAQNLGSQDENHPLVAIINQPSDLDTPEWLKVFPGLSTDSGMFLRLTIKGEEMGVLLVSARGHNRFLPEHGILMEAIREPVAIAMVNARRYNDLKRMRDLLAEDNRALAADIKRTVGMEVVGADFGLKDVMTLVRQVAQSSSPALLLGETGTGKEVIANAIHMASPRSKEPMISMQCGAIPDSLLDSELFGHEKGAFTGAIERKRGRFERAHRGTLFLDEIGELSPEAQVKLLRVLQEKCFERVGGTKTVEVDVRVIAATHRDLDKMVQEGKFREDLWYRLNVLPIRIPPLRLRKEDIPSLVHYFIERKAREMNLQLIPEVNSKALKNLSQYEWPGNVRELQNVIERALILSRIPILEIPELLENHNMANKYPSPNAGENPLTIDMMVKYHIQNVLHRVNGRIKGKGGAAELLGMNPSTLRFRMKKLGIKIKKEYF